MACINCKHPRRKSADSKGFSCLVPKSIFPCRIRTKKSESRRGWIKEKIKKLGEWKSSGIFDDCKRKMESAALTPDYVESCKSYAPRDGSSGNLKKVTLFNLGVGFGLVNLLAESKDELNKIKDLHKEMEAGLKSLKDRLGANDHDIKRVGSCQELQSSLRLEDPKSSQQSTKKMNLLEDELEAELEHLQLHIDPERMVSQEEKHSQVMVEDSAPEGSFYTINFEEWVDPSPKAIHNEEQYGVSPYELESRLHELLEARQQERINELEEALHCATQKIQEKERELSWWKDNAKLFFQHVPVHNERLALTDQ
ncbi:hypothetical protein LIER_15242 [Lithospermum erythrorhizon]|uniref:Protein POLAR LOCALIZATION DURING ASYMMETRIC DIVISION AND REDISTRIBUTION-like n=1 Tax=Lithospermum erythrorhizon TaxID=34254 RepID=A0AAV3Q2I5_LITER